MHIHLITPTGYFYLIEKIDLLLEKILFYYFTRVIAPSVSNVVEEPELFKL